MVRLGTLACLVLWSLTTYAQTLSSVTGAAANVLASPLEQWDSLRLALSDYAKNIQTPPTVVANVDRRPNLPGVSGKNLELLQDAIARKYVKMSAGGSLPGARNYIATRITEKRVDVIHGLMAEAIYVDKHPEWKYVSSPTASQHDVYARMPNNGRGIQTGQVKYHVNGQPDVYARDMRRDWRSKYFLVPDDHVMPLKEYLGKQQRYRDAGRVLGIGATSKQIDHATRQAISEARITRSAPYGFLATISAVQLAPIVMDFYRGDIDGTTAMRGLAHDGTVAGSAYLTDAALKKVKGGLYRGTTRGNIITASVVLITQTTWNAQQYGGFNEAFNNPDFILDLSGDAAGTILAGVGVVAGGTIGLTVGGLIGEAIGVTAEVGKTVGQTVGAVAGGWLGYQGGSIGGRKTALWAIETFQPELLQEKEKEFILAVKNDVKASLTELQRLDGVSL